MPSRPTYQDALKLRVGDMLPPGLTYEGSKFNLDGAIILGVRKWPGRVGFSVETADQQIVAVHLDEDPDA